MLIANKRKWLLFITLLSSYFALFAATTDVNFQIIAPVQAALRLSVTRGMDFGEFVAKQSRDVSAATSARIVAIGNSNASVTGSFSNDHIDLACQSSSCGSDTIRVDTFTCSGSGMSSNCSGTLDGSGNRTIDINAIMHESTIDDAGNYSGTQTFNLVYA